MSALVTAPQDKVVAIETTLKSALPNLRQLMPSQVLDKPDVFVRCAVLAMRQNPTLKECEPMSIVLSIAQACSLGLPPNTPLGLSYLVPFKGKCQLIPGYKGLVRLAIQSGEVKAIDARLVYKDDEFDLEYGLEEKLYHKPNRNVVPVDADIVGAYAVAKLANSERKFEYMSRAQIDGIRARSMAKDNGPWVSDYAEMARKTVIRRLCKGLPLSEENLNHQALGKALHVQAKAEAGEPSFADFLPDFTDAEEASSKPAKGSLAEKAGT